MIRNIFIPELIGTYYLFAKTIVGIDITKTHIYATKIIAKGNQRTIIESIEQPIEINNGLELKERLTQALQTVKDKLGSFDDLNIALPSSSAVFKEITIPFIGEKKVKMVIPFEVESMLPFSLNQAFIDAIITNEDKEKNITEVLVAAITKDFLNNYLEPFYKAELKPSIITIDMFEIYALYSMLYNSKSTKSQNVVALIDLDIYNTRVALIIDGQLRYIRTLNKGIKNIAHKLGSNIGKNTSDIMQDFMRFGIKSENKELFQDLVNELQFTLLTSLKKHHENKELDSVVLTGFGADIQGITDLICAMLKTDCKILEPSTLLRNGIAHSKIPTIGNRFLVSIATALPSTITSSFNLAPYAEEKTNTTLAKQLFTLFILTGLLLISFLTYSFVQVRKLKSTYNNFTNQAIKKLKSSIDLKKQYYKNLREANTEAQQKVTALQDAISQLINKKGYALLYLDELSRVIDQERTQLKINKMDITPEAITIQGSVKDIEAAKVLEIQFAQSPLFNLKSSLQTPDFTKNPLVIEIVDPKSEA